MFTATPKRALVRAQRTQLKAWSPSLALTESAPLLLPRWTRPMTKISVPETSSPERTASRIAACSVWIA